jgi:hypothetical protein
MARAVAGVLAPVLAAYDERLQRILTITDPALRAQRWTELQGELAILERDYLTDPAAVQGEIERISAKALAAGLASRREALANADESGGRWVTIRGNAVFIEDEGWTGTPKDLHKRAAGIMKGFKSVEHPTLGEVLFTSQGRKKTLFDKRTSHEFQSVKALPVLVSRGKIVSTQADRKGRQDISKFYKLEHDLEIGKTRYRAEVTIKEAQDGRKSTNRFYLHRIHPK